GFAHRNADTQLLQPSHQPLVPGRIIGKLPRLLAGQRIGIQRRLRYVDADNIHLLCHPAIPSLPVRVSTHATVRVEEDAKRTTLSHGFKPRVGRSHLRGGRLLVTTARSQRVLKFRDTRVASVSEPGEGVAAPHPPPAFAGAGPLPRCGRGALWRGSV